MFCVSCEAPEAITRPDSPAASASAATSAAASCCSTYPAATSPSWLPPTPSATAAMNAPSIEQRPSISHSTLRPFKHLSSQRSLFLPLRTNASISI